jgi:hypothetical protein
MTAPSDNTPLSIIPDAYFDAGLLQEGQPPSSEQMLTGMRKLIDLIRLWQTQGLKLWLQQDVAITLVESQARYQMGPGLDVSMVKPTRVTQGYYLTTSTGDRRPLRELSRQEYTTLGNTTTEGATNSYFIDKQAASLDVYLWLVPDATAVSDGTVHLITQYQVTGPVLLTETMNFPDEWRIALRWGLADEVCTGQPQAIMDRCAQRAVTYRTMLEDNDVEDASTFFTPDSRSGYSSGRFR